MTGTYFLLDPDYQTLAAGKLHLKFDAVGSGNSRTLRFLALITVCYILLALILSFVVVGYIAAQIDYQKNGSATLATIVKCEMVSSRSGEAPEITYTYEVDSVRYEGQHFVPRRSMSCAQFPSNGVLAAQYLSDRPSQSRITASLANRDPWEESIMYGAFLVGMAFYVLVGIAAPLNMAAYVLAKKRYRRLIKKGVVLTGEVVQANGEVRGTRCAFCVTVTYTFETPGGRWLWGKQSRQREDLRDKSLPACGTPVHILYADDRAYAML